MTFSRNALLFAAGLAVLLTLSSPLRAGDYRDEAVKRLGTLEEKFGGLAEAVPESKYKWRPEEGVRSIVEVYRHVTSANFGLGGPLGTAPPESFDRRGYEKSSTAKGETTAKLKESFAHFRGAIEKASADAESPVSLFRQDMTARQAVWNLLEHLSEHLGQSIAYARANGVVPPWTAARGGD